MFTSNGTGQVGSDGHRLALADQKLPLPEAVMESWCVWPPANQQDLGWFGSASPLTQHGSAPGSVIAPRRKMSPSWGCSCHP